MCSQDVRLNKVVLDSAKGLLKLVLILHRTQCSGKRSEYSLVIHPDIGDAAIVTGTVMATHVVTVTK